MYQLVAIVSVIVRQFYLPNPFNCFGDMAIIYNWAAEPAIHILSYLLVGQVYQSGSAPTFGSILYLLAYSLITGILWILGLFSFAWWWITVVSIICGIVVYVLHRFLGGWYES